MKIVITPHEGAALPGKLADVELIFEGTEPLAGLKLIGWSLWRRSNGGYNVTHPARSYSVNGERRSFALVRPTGDASASDAIRAQIIEAYEAFMRQQAVAS